MVQEDQEEEEGAAEVNQVQPLIPAAGQEQSTPVTRPVVQGHVPAELLPPTQIPSFIAPLPLVQPHARQQAQPPPPAEPSLRGGEEPTQAPQPPPQPSVPSQQSLPSTRMTQEYVPSGRATHAPILQMPVSREAWLPMLLLHHLRCMSKECQWEVLQELCLHLHHHHLDR